MPASSLWQGMTTEMRLPRYMSWVSLGLLRAPGGGGPPRAPDPRPRRDSRAGASPRLPCARAWACGGRLGGPPPPGARASEDYARAGASGPAAFVVGWVPQVARVARAGGWPLSLRQALRSFRLDHSFSTVGIMRGLKRMLMVRKHS